MTEFCDVLSIDSRINPTFSIRVECFGMRIDYCLMITYQFLEVFLSFTIFLRL